MRRASFFYHSPPVPVFAPLHQTICPQERRGDVATSEFAPFYPREGRGSVAIVHCVVTSAPPSQFVVSVRSTIVVNVLTPTLVGMILFIKDILSDILCR